MYNKNNFSDFKIFEVFISLWRYSEKVISNNFVSHDIRNISIDIYFKDNSDSLHLEGAGVSATAKKSQRILNEI